MLAVVKFYTATSAAGKRQDILAMFLGAFPETLLGKQAENF